MADDTQQQTPGLDELIQRAIQAQIAAASGQQQVQLPSLPTPQVQTQYSNDPEKGPDLLQRIGLALGGGAMPGAPAELRAQMGSQGLLNFGIGLMSAGKFATPGEVFAGGLRGAQAGLLGNEAALAGQQEYALNAQTKMAELAAQQQKNRTEALTALVPLLQLRGRLGLPPLFGPGSAAGGPGGGPGGGGGEAPEVERDPKYETAGEQANNPGNLMTTSAPGQTGVIKLSGGRTLAAFPDVPTGVAANAANLAAYQTVHGINTVADAVKRWVSDPKADLTSYINDVSAALGVKPTDKIDLTDPKVQRAFILAQQPHESGGKKQWLNPADVDAGIALAQKRLQGAPGGVAGAQPPATAPGSAVGPYKVAGTAPVAPPSVQPSSGLPEPPVPPAGAVPTVTTPEEASATAKAAGTPVQVPGGQGLWAKPEGGSTITPNLIMPGTQVAGPVVPPAGTEQPPAATPGTPAAQPPASPAAPPPARAPDLTARNDDGTYVVPNDKLSLPDYQQRFRHVPTAEELTQRGLVIPGNEAEAQAAARGVQEAEAAAQVAQTAANRAQAGYTGYGTVADLLKANTEAQAKAQDARQKYAEMLQDTTKTNAAALQKYYEKQDTDLAANYKAEVLDPRNAAALEAQRGETQKDIERIKGGQTFHQKLEEQAAEYAQTNTLKPMSEAALKAHQMNLGLAQMQPLLQELPKGGGALGSVLDAHPNLAPLFNTAGILSDRQADAVRLINGLVSNISTEMKPTGLGALREYEWDAFKAQLPNLLSTPVGQQKALALLYNMNERIQQESAWTNKYFNRKVPDETSPGQMRSAHNLETEDADNYQQKMDRELGPIVPSYTGPPTGTGQAQWERSLPPGKPYYKTWAVPDPKNPGQPLRDAEGNVQTTTTLEVRPWR